MTHPERLGEFLRQKRNSIAPESIGLGKPVRSRTPGLRREDVADLAQISTVWYAKLERGKAERVSRQVLVAIARAMQCDDSEIRYLLQLAGHHEWQPKTETCTRLSQMSQRFYPPSTHCLHCFVMTFTTFCRLTTPFAPWWGLM